MNNEITLDEFNDPNNLVVADINNLVRDNEYYIKQTFNKGTSNEFINIKKITFKGYAKNKTKLLYEELGRPKYLIKQSIDEVKEETPSNPVLKGGNRNRSKRRCSRHRCSKRKNMRRKKLTKKYN